MSGQGVGPVSCSSRTPATTRATSAACGARSRLVVVMPTGLGGHAGLIGPRGCGRQRQHTGAPAVVTAEGPGSADLAGGGPADSATSVNAPLGTGPAPFSCPPGGAVPLSFRRGASGSPPGP